MSMTVRDIADEQTPKMALGAREWRPHPSDPPVAWRVNCETATLLGWGAAVLLQLAHPLVAAGVAGHSVAVNQPERRFERLTQTINAMLLITFGTEEERQRTGAGINSIHDHIYGELSETVGQYTAGTRYSAHDPALLAWVQLTLVALLPRAYELFVGPLTEEERDRYCRESTAMGPLLGIPEAQMYTTYAAVEAAIAARIADGTVAVGPAAREMSRDIVAPTIPRWGPFISPLTRLPTIGLLPPAIRAAYGFRWTPGHERTLRLFAAITRAVLPRLPRLTHHWPAARRAYRALAAGKLGY
jgi:uncharacterized protein (DUF2236 family)